MYRGRAKKQNTEENVGRKKILQRKSELWIVYKIINFIISLLFRDSIWNYPFFSHFCHVQLFCSFLLALVRFFVQKSLSRTLFLMCFCQVFLFSTPETPSLIPHPLTEHRSNKYLYFITKILKRFAYDYTLSFLFVISIRILSRIFNSIESRI